MPTRMIYGHVFQRYNDDGTLESQTFEADDDPAEWHDEHYDIIAEPSWAENLGEDVELVQPSVPSTQRAMGYLGTIPANPTAPTCESLSFDYGVCQSLDLKDFVVTLRFPYPNEAQPRAERYIVKLGDWDAIRELMLKGKKIDAIKKLRAHTNMMLKEGKSVVEVIIVLDNIIQRAVNELKCPVPEDKEPVKEIGLCYKCENRIEKPGTDFIVKGGEKIQCTEITGCKLTRYFQNGDNCPLIEK